MKEIDLRAKVTVDDDGNITAIRLMDKTHESDPTLDSVMGDTSDLQAELDEKLAKNQKPLEVD